MPTKKPIRAAAKNRQIIAMQAEIAIEAAEAGEDGKPSGPPKFDVVAYRGKPVVVGGWDLPVLIDLEGMEFARNVIGDLFHNHDQLVGHATEKSKTESEVLLKGIISAATQYSEQVVASAAAGFPWEASVEVTPHKIVEIAAGKTVKANGSEFAGPLYVARKSTLTGFGFVPHGADPTTEVKIAAEAASHKEQTMKEDCKAWVAEMVPSLDLKSLTPEQIAAYEADFEGQKGKRNPKSTKKVEGSSFDDYKLEAKRCEEIRDIGRKFVEARKHLLRATDIEAVSRMTDEAIEKEMSPLEFRVELQDAMGDVKAHTVFAPKQRDEGLSAAVIEAAICMSGDLPDGVLVKRFGDKTLQAARDRFRGGIGLKQIYRLAAKANTPGFSYDGDDVTLEMQKAAFNKQPINRIEAAGFSSYDLSSILSSSANKFLLEGWGQGEMTWQDITDVVSVRDFKTATFYKLSGNLTYKKIAPGGQITHGGVSTDSYTVQNETYGRMFSIDRTAIINDDLSAITRIPLELGIAANDAFNEVFWTEFLDNASFFASGNANLSTGAVTAANALTALAAAEAIFFAQTKPNGTPLGKMADVWLLPPGSFRVGYNALFPGGNVTGGSSTVPEKNSLAGLYKPVMSAYIANAAYSGYSAVKNYLLANKPGFSTMLTSFLNGRRNPVVETAEAMFNVLGVEMRAYHDFGCNKMEYRAGVQGSGA